MRKGFALMEMLALIAILAVMAIVIAALTRSLVVEIPRAHRIIETNTSVHNMLTHLRNDIEAAVQLPDSFAGKRTDDKNLLIELPSSVICYACGKDEVVRKVLKGNKAGGNTDVWPVAKAKINWHRWRKDGTSYAAEIGTHFEYKQGRHVETKLANNHVYFVGAAAEAISEK
jgi:type II secretory pathway component PulJ